jgi:hypothetical protein
MLVEKKMRWPLGGNFELPTWFITAVKIKFLNFDNNQSMFTKNQNLYLIIYIMFVSQALRNLPRQKTASVTFRKNINMYVTPEKIKGRSVFML